MLKKSKIYVTIASVVLITTTLISTTKASFFGPGSEEDPVVSKSYVDKKYEELKSYIDTELKDTSKPSNNNSGDFVIVELQKGQKIIGGASTEIIVRSGVAKAIVRDLGGLSDLTLGRDLGQDERVVSNHLILVPRNDGRGIYAEANGTFVMVRGDYSIE